MSRYALHLEKCIFQNIFVGYNTPYESIYLRDDIYFLAHQTNLAVFAIVGETIAEDYLDIIYKHLH